MKHIISAICIFLSATTGYADFDYLKKNDPAPYAGYLITPDREQSFRLMDKKLDISEQLNQSLADKNTLDAKTIAILEDRVNTAALKNNSLESELTESKNTSFWSHTGYFMLGAILTGFISYGAVHATK